MYYNNGQEQELGFDAFIAPDDFNRTAQPVDIYEVFKREYALNSQARYIYYYSDGNYPLTLTPTADEYYRYGHRNGGVDVIYDVPLSSEGGVATTIWGASGNTSGGDESGFTHRWVVVYRVSTAKFFLDFNVVNALWIYLSTFIYKYRQYTGGYGNLNMKWIHCSNLNSITDSDTMLFYKSGVNIEGTVNVPETMTKVGNGAFCGWQVANLMKIHTIRMPDSQNVTFLGNYLQLPVVLRNIYAGASDLGKFATLPYDNTPFNNQSYHTELSILQCSEANNFFTSFENCDILYSKDCTIIEWIAPKTVRGLTLPDQLPQAQIDTLGTKLSANIMQGFPLYIGTLITDLTNLYLSNKSFTTVAVGAGNTAFSVENGMLRTATNLIKAGTSNTGDLIIPNVTTIEANCFLRCSGYTSLILPAGYDCAIYNNFTFANFSAASLNTAILNLANGTAGTPKYFVISKTSLDALNVAYPNAVSNAAARYINIINIPVLDSSLKLYTDIYNINILGSLWYDYSVNANNLTIPTTATLYADSFRLNSGTITSPISNIGCNNVTMSIWYKYDGSTALGKLLSLINTTENKGMGLMIHNGSGGSGDILTVIYDGVSWSALTTGTTKYTMPLNVWKYITLTRDSTTTNLYIDGVLIGSTTSTPLNNTTIKYFYGGNKLGFYGSEAYYNRALTAAEVLQNFNATRNKYGI